MAKLFSMKAANAKWFTFREPDGGTFRLKMKYPSYKEKKIDISENEQNTEKIYEKVKNLILVTLVDWSGFFDEDGKDVKFSPEILKNPIQFESFINVKVLAKNDDGKEEEKTVSACIMDLTQDISKFHDKESF